MSERHTAGPWRFDPHPAGGYAIDAPGLGEYTIASAWDPWDASLIAAAPELLACLQLALDVLATKVSIKAVDGEHVFHVAQDMQRAIAKATGSEVSA